ncbi:hypothetical protein ACO1O0_007185 [Amphichorda felina]
MAGTSPTSGMEWLRDGTGRLIHSFTSSDIIPSQTPVSSQEDSELICSFNWTKERQPTIFVPGGAPDWAPPKLPVQLRPDRKIRQAAQDDPLLPTYPFEPVFRAAGVMNPGIRFNSMDILLRRNTLRKLLTFCRGQKQSHFRIQLFCVENTLIAERCEQSASMMIHGSGDSGFGHSFERAFTRPHPGCESSSGHHRVLLYNIGSVKCSVCFEVDAAYTEPGTDHEVEAATRPAQHQKSLLDAITPSTDISRVAEMKMSRRGLESTLPQMWFGRNRYYIRGIRPTRYPRITRVAVKNLPEEFTRWEQQPDIQQALRKMDTLLSQLRDIVRGTEEKAGVLVYDGNAHSSLQVFAYTSGRAALPTEIIEKFWDAGKDS